MRPLLVLAFLLLAGCAQAPPPALPPGERPPEPAPIPYGPPYRDGPWTLRVAPAVLSGAPGEEIPFTVELRHDGLPTETTVLEPNSHFAWLDGTTSRSVPVAEQTTVARGRILGGAATHLVMQVVELGGGQRFRYIEGPAILGGNETATRVPAQVEQPHAAPGIVARVEEGRVDLTFGLGPDGDVPFCTRPEVATDFLLVERDGARELWGFVKRVAHHMPECREDLHHHAVHAVTPALPPGELAVRVVTAAWCQCEPQRHEARVTVP